MAEQEKNGWGEFRQLFLKAMDDFDKIKEDVIQLKIDQAVIKFKLFMWGAIGATLGTAMFNLAIWVIKEKVIKP
jgi:hypothetical protein